MFGAGIFVGGRISSEIENLWQRKDDNQELRNACFDVLFRQSRRAYELKKKASKVEAA